MSSHSCSSRDDVGLFLTVCAVRRRPALSFALGDTCLVESCVYLIRDPLGRSDCVEKALLVTETTDSMSESPKSPTTSSLSGDRCRRLIRYVDVVPLPEVDRSLSDSPVYCWDQSAAGQRVFVAVRGPARTD